MHHPRQGTLWIVRSKLAWVQSSYSSHMEATSKPAANYTKSKLALKKRERALPPQFLSSNPKICHLIRNRDTTQRLYTKLNCPSKVRFLARKNSSSIPEFFISLQNKNIFKLYHFPLHLLSIFFWKKIRWLGPRQKTAALFFLRVSSLRLRWIISLEWLKIEKSDVWISNYSVFLSDLSDLSPMLEQCSIESQTGRESEEVSANHRSPITANQSPNYRRAPSRAGPNFQAQTQQFQLSRSSPWLLWQRRFSVVEKVVTGFSAPQSIIFYQILLHF